ncbi:unnamed protein product [Linum trigynum]|uniref:Zinc finger MYM-type protein 1-like n=1 Tax=Linum trigynum TaxID=586398 RepID=A0AAV2FW25_9ROSI
MNQPGHIDKAMKKQSSEEIKKNITRVKTSIDDVRYLALQGVAFRGRDETADSKNPGNFIQLLKYTRFYSEEVNSVVLENAPKNAKYTSHEVQKQILHVLAKKIRKQIFEDIGDSKFSIIVDEASDESRHEQMAIILRFVDVKGLIQERFLNLVHVKDTTSKTLHSAICSTLASHKFSLQNLRGQGYDGASNMRGEWKGLHALFLKDFPQAYYVHCMAHRLQLSLVAASREVDRVNEFFTKLPRVVTAITGSTRRLDELEEFQEDDYAQKLASGEIESGKGANQIRNVQRACDTRWSSHLSSVASLIHLYGPSCRVLENISNDCAHYKTRGDASTALRTMESFEFIFILHMMKDILSTTDLLCKALQRKSQDIVNAMRAVETTTKLLNQMRNEDWDSLLAKVTMFCQKHDINVPDLSAPHYESRRRQDGITNEHFYHFDVFNAAIDVQIEEIRARFDDKVLELLKLSSSLDPRDGYKAFNIGAICDLAEKYYPLDFSEKDLDDLKFELKHFHADAPTHPKLQNLSSLAELCHGLAVTGKSKEFNLVDRLIRLILTLPVSTATGERAFSAMKIVKNRLRNKMNDDFLADNLVIFIEREIAETFSLDAILSDFSDLKERRALLKYN